MKYDSTPAPHSISRWLGVVLLALGLLTSIRVSADQTASGPLPGPQKKEQKKKVKKLSGPDLYAMHCNRCHPERYSPERTEAQWQTILLHMRVRANLPADQARTILKFLQEDSGK